MQPMPLKRKQWIWIAAVFLALEAAAVAFLLLRS